MWCDTLQWCRYKHHGDNSCAIYQALASVLMENYSFCFCFRTCYLVKITITIPEGFAKHLKLSLIKMKFWFIWFSLHSCSSISPFWSLWLGYCCVCVKQPICHEIGKIKFNDDNELYSWCSLVKLSPPKSFIYDWYSQQRVYFRHLPILIIDNDIEVCLGKEHVPLYIILSTPSIV